MTQLLGGVELQVHGVVSIHQPGTSYFVNGADGSDDATGLDWDHALASLDAAVNKCAENHNDVIYVAPTHTENLGADSAVDVDKAGIHIVGIRRGRQMPTLTATAVAGDFKLAADNCSVRNLRFLGGINATTGVLEVTGNDCAVIDCEYRDVTGQALDVLVTDNALRLLVDGFRVLGASADGGDSAIMLDECDGAVIRNCHLVGNFDLGAIEFRNVASADVRIHDCVIKTYGSEDLAISDTVTGTTGIVGPNVFAQLADDAANITEAISGNSLVVMDHGVHVVNAAGEKSMALNWTASTDA